MKKNQKGLSPEWLIVAVLGIIIIVGVVFLKNQNRVEPKDQTSQNSQSDIQNNNELNTAATDLDNTEIDNLDNDLNQLEETANF